MKDWLCDEFKKSKYAMPDRIRKARNIAIVLGIFELICVFASIPFYARRRSKIVIALIILSFLASICGTWAKLRLSYWGLFAHAAFTIAIVGGLYIYLVIDFCIASDSTAETHTGGMGETWVLVLLSLPLLFIFAMGIYSLVLVLMVDDELEERRKAGTDGEPDPGFDGLGLENHTVEVL